MAPSIALPALLLARAPLGLSGSSVAPHPSVHPAAFGEGGERPPPPSLGHLCLFFAPQGDGIQEELKSLSFVPAAPRANFEAA